MLHKCQCFACLSPNHCSFFSSSFLCLCLLINSIPFCGIYFFHLLFIFDDSLCFFQFYSLHLPPPMSLFYFFSLSLSQSIFFSGIMYVSNLDIIVLPVFQRVIVCLFIKFFVHVFVYLFIAIGKVS